MDHAIYQLSEDGRTGQVRLTFGPGEYIFEGLTKAAEKLKIESAEIQGGSALVNGPLMTGWWDREQRDYVDRKVFEDEYDLEGVNANIARVEGSGDRAIHFHAVLARTPTVVAAGHIMTSLLKEGFDAAKHRTLCTKGRDVIDTRFRYDMQSSITAEFLLAVENRTPARRVLHEGCGVKLLNHGDHGNGIIERPIQVFTGPDYR